MAKEMMMSRNPCLNVEPKGSARRCLRGTEGVGEARRFCFRTLHGVGKEFGQDGEFFRSCITKTRPLTTRLRRVSPHVSPRGKVKGVRGPSVQGLRPSAPSGTACRAPTFLSTTLSTASKPNDVMAGLSRASTVGSREMRARTSRRLGSRCFAICVAGSER